MLRIAEIFQTLCLQPLIKKKHNSKYTKEDFTNKLAEIAKKCIPKNSVQHLWNGLWFDEEFKKVTCLLRAVPHKSKITRTTSHLVLYKHHRVKVRRITKKKKKQTKQKTRETAGKIISINSNPLLYYKHSRTRATPLCKLY